MKKFDRPPIHSPTSYEYRNLIAQSAGTEANNSEVRNKELPLLPLNSTRSLRATVQKSWLWEILTYCFSLVCMIAVIAVLIFEHGKQLDQWAFPIGPNAMISFIITLAKSSFLLAMTETISQLKWLHYNGKSNRLSDLKLFDEASRGPVGSLRLLFAKNKSNTVLASSAAIVVIAALFVDPFVQLVFHFPSRRALAPIQNAAFQIAQVYNPSHQVDTQHYVAQTVDPEMEAAIFRAMYGGVRQPLSSCPSGNCTWTNITTLGVCGECEGITHHIETLCWDNSSYCEYSMPGNLTLTGSNGDPSGTHGCEPNKFGMTRWNSSARVLGVGADFDSAPLPGTEAILVSFESVQLLASLDAPIGSRCTFTFCTKNYAGIDLTDGILGSSTPMETSLLLDYFAVEELEGFKVFQYMYSSSPDSDGSTPSIYYKVPQDVYLQTEIYLQNMFSTGWTSCGRSSLYNHPSSDATTTAPNIGRQLAAATNLSETIQAITDSMTEVVRTNPASTTQAGISYVERTFIEIQWGYLVYPIALVLLALVVLVAVIKETKRQGVIAWKSSALALLFHELGGWELPKRRIRDVKDLDGVAERLRGRLSERGHISSFTKEG